MSFEDDLKDEVRRGLPEKGKTIPELCEKFGIKDEIKMMSIIAELEISGDAIIDNKFEKVYREDGGAIYLAKYKKVLKENQPPASTEISAQRTKCTG